MGEKTVSGSGYGLDANDPFMQSLDEFRHPLVSYSATERWCIGIPPHGFHHLLFPFTSPTSFHAFRNESQ